MTNYFYMTFAIAAAPLLLRHFQQLNSRSMYQYFPFVLAFVAWAVWQAFQRTAGERFEISRRWESGLSVLATVCLMMAVALFNPWLCAVSVLLIAAALIHRFRDKFVGKSIWAAWASLLLVIPLPFDLTDALSQQLQQFSSSSSSQWLDFLGVNHLLRGNVISIPGQQLFVDEACSGIVSFMSVVACTVMYSVWKRRQPLHAVALIASGVLWTLVMNVLRISFIAVAAYSWDWDLSSGAPHTVLGAVIFALTTVAILSMDCLLMLTFAPIPLVAGLDASKASALVQAWNQYSYGELSDGEAPDPNRKSRISATKPGSADLRINRATSIALSLIASAAIVFQLGPILTRGSSNHDPQAIVQAFLDADISLPTSLGVWQRVQADDVARSANREHAEHSKTAVYRGPNGRLLIASIDFPFVGAWHDLCVCYRKSGWRQSSRTRLTNSQVDANPTNCLIADFEDTNRLRYGHLIYGHVSTKNEQCAPPKRDERWGGFLSRIKAKLNRRKTLGERATTFQLQVFSESTDEPSADEIEVQSQLYDELRKWFQGAFGEMLEARG